MMSKSKRIYDWTLQPVKIECPFCVRCFVHLHALKVHVAKVHKEYAEDFLQCVTEDYEEDSSHTADSKAVNVQNTQERSQRQNLSEVNVAQGLNKSSRHVRQPKSILPVPATPTISEVHRRPVITNAPEHRQVPSRRHDTNEELPRDPESLDTEPGILIPIGTLTLCQFCNESFYDKKYLLMHIRLEHVEDLVYPTEAGASQTPLECAENGEDIRDFVQSGGTRAARKRKLEIVKPITNVKKNKMAKTFDPKFTCRICSKYFYNKEVLKRHTKILHRLVQRSGRPLDTPKTIGAAAQHQRKSPLNENNVQRSGHNLRGNHQVEDTKTQVTLQPNLVATYQCPLCPLTITAASDETLITHVMNEHKELSGKNVKCKYCPHVIKSKNGLLRAIVPHTRTHEEEKPFSCDFCEKRFRQSYQKIVHDKECTLKHQVH